MELSKHQLCPYCNHEIDDAEAEWEEGLHQVDCYHCKKTYYVSPKYKFLGFKVELPCDKCGEHLDECECD